MAWAQPGGDPGAHLIASRGAGIGAPSYLADATLEAVSTRGPGQASLTTAKVDGVLAGPPGQLPSTAPSPHHPTRSGLATASEQWGRKGL